LLYDPDKGRAAKTLRLPGEACGGVGFEPDQALLPQTEAAFPGFRLLQEYYVQPSKFAFVELEGIRRAAELGPITRLGVVVRLKHRLREVRRVGLENFKLHCVPIVN